MGLLSSDRSRSRLTELLVHHDSKLCVLVYLAGIIWFLALAYPPLNAGTYFSENALLPGLVESQLPQMFSSALQLQQEVQSEMEKEKKLTPQNWVFQKFKETGLETYRQNFSLIYPFRAVTNRIMQGENVYSILRARRSASTEALVLSVPLRPLISTEKTPTHGGIALALALAKEFKRKPYWSKDIIFLFTDFDEIGTLAWLDSYHQTKSEYIVGEDLEARSGPIQAALNLELPAEPVHHYNVRLEGLNGQLPNLDLVNLVVKLCRRERAQVSLHNLMEKRRYQQSELEDFKLSLTTMLSMMWMQASGAPSGCHGMFHKFHIEALTLEGVVKKKGSHNHIDTAARIIEGTFRSLNNLLERFHQSFFFYLLPSTSRYVSIGMYMPPFGLMIAACLIKGLAMWIVSSDRRAEQAKKRKEETEKLKKRMEEIEKSEDEKKDQDHGEKAAEEALEKVKEKLKNASDEDLLDDDVDADPNNPANQGFLSVTPIILVSMLLAWMAHQGPELLMSIMPKFRIHTEDMVIYSLLAIFTAAVLFPKLMTRKSNHPNSLLIDWRLLKSLALIGQTLALACVALLNISQAFFLAAVMVPVTCSVQPCNNRIGRWLQLLLLVFISPLSLMFLVGLTSVWPQPSTLDLLYKGYTNTKHVIFLGLMDAYLFNAWSEMIMSSVIFPLWLMFWALPWADPTL